MKWTQGTFSSLWICSWLRTIFWKDFFSLFTAMQCYFVINQVWVGLFPDASGFDQFIYHTLIKDCLNYYSHRSWYLQFCCSSILPCLFLALCFHMIVRIRFLIWREIFFDFNWDYIELIGVFMDTCHLYSSLGVWTWCISQFI